MEVAATAAESAALDALAARGGRDLLVWPEGRERPIRMLDRLPLVWAAAGAPPVGGASFRGEALRGEFFAFQLGVYAAQFFWRNFAAMLRASPTPRAPSGTRRCGRWSC